MISEVEMQAFNQENNGNSLIRTIKEHNIILLVILLICIGFLAFKRYLLSENLYIFLDIGSDTYNHGYPYLVNIADYIRNEGIPRWSFYHGMGQNIFPGGINDPFNLFLCLLGREYLPYGIIYVELCKIILGGVLFFYYLKTLSLTRYTCILGGILFAFSGYMILGSGWYGHSMFMLSAIFFLFSFEKLLKEDTWFYFPLSVALIVSRSAFYLYILGAFLSIYAIFRVLEEGGWSFKKVCVLFVKLAGLGTLGLLIVAPFVANDLLRVIESPRVGGESGYYNKLMSTQAFSFGNYLHNITAILRFFSNDILGTGSDYKGWYNYLEAPAFYCGLSTLLLFPQIFISLNNKKKILYSIFLIIWILLIVFPFFRYGFYLFTGDYYKGGLSFIIPFVLLFYSLHAFDFIYRNKKINKVLLLVTLVVLLCILNFSYFPDDQNPIKDNIRILTTGFLICYSLIFLLYGKSKNLKIIKYSLLIIICIEAYMFSTITSSSRTALTAKEYNQDIGYNDGTQKLVELIRAKDISFFRVAKNYSSGIAVHKSLNDALMQNYYGTPSYHQFNQKYYIRFLAETGIIKSDEEAMTRWAPGLSSRPLLQTIASVKYFLSKSEVPEFFKRTYSPFARYKDILALKNDYSLPLGFTYDRFVTYERFKDLNDNQKERIFLKAFVFEKGDDVNKDFESLDIDKLNDEYTLQEYGSDIINLKRESIVITKHNQNNIIGHIKVENRKLLFFSIPFDRGWDIKIDGVNQKVSLINLGFMGVVVPRGIHEIELTYTPPFLYSGTIIMIISILLFAFLIFNAVRKRDLVTKK